jgi:hypothetical protein
MALHHVWLACKDHLHTMWWQKLGFCIVQSGGYLPDIKKISNQASSNSNSLGIMKIFLRFLGENM